MTVDQTAYPDPLAEDHLYGHLDMRSSRISDVLAEGTMPIGDDIRTPGGIRAALPALLIELITGQFAISLGMIVLSDMTLHLRDRGVDLDAVHGEVRLVRTGRSRVIGVGRLDAVGRSITNRWLRHRQHRRARAVGRPVDGAATRERSSGQPTTDPRRDGDVHPRRGLGVRARGRAHRRGRSPRIACTAVRSS